MEKNEQFQKEGQNQQKTPVQAMKDHTTFGKESQLRPLQKTSSNTSNALLQTNTELQLPQNTSSDANNALLQTDTELQPEFQSQHEGLPLQSSFEDLFKDSELEWMDDDREIDSSDSREDTQLELDIEFRKWNDFPDDGHADPLTPITYSSSTTNCCTHHVTLSLNLDSDDADPITTHPVTSGLDDLLDCEERIEEEPAIDFLLGGINSSKERTRTLIRYLPVKTICRKKRYGHIIGLTLEDSRTSKHSPTNLEMLVFSLRILLD